MSKQDFIAFLIGFAKENPNTWLNSTFEVNGKPVSLKAFGKWVQVARIPSSVHPQGFAIDGTTDCKTYKKYKEELETLFNTL